MRWTSCYLILDIDICIWGANQPGPLSLHSPRILTPGTEYSMRTGITTLPLHPGKAPQWLLKRQKPLAREIVNLIVDEYGPREFVKMVSDPYWFQALSCVLAFDWHSSGTTPVTTAVLKWAVIPEEHGFAIAGGKGKTSMKTPQDIENFGTDLSLSDSRIERLKYTSRMTAKVDNTAIQSGYSLYHHTLFFYRVRRLVSGSTGTGPCIKNRTTIPLALG